MQDLFSTQSKIVPANNASRTVRQKEAIQKWVDNKLCGTMIMPTGTGDI